MALSTKNWHPNFMKYMEDIIAHPHYKGLPIIRKKDGSPQWLATAQSEIGLGRIKWANDKSIDLGIPVGPGSFAKVMYTIHPTKMKACQICGTLMSISYIYPNANLAKSIKKKFDVEIGIYDSIYSVWDNLIKIGFKHSDIVEFMNSKFNSNFSSSLTKEDILDQCEILCRLGDKSHLGPGAMSNFPDRFDGFHSYNRCHRSLEDKGRSKENLKSYTRDRRAYEYWSDGNIQAANQFMGSAYFQGSSADHIGPISLGFIHDPHYLRRMSSSDNSSKRDRLTRNVIEEVLAIQKETAIYPMSWYSSEIWDFIVENYEYNDDKISGDYRNLLKQNMSNYMYILQEILGTGGQGLKFLIDYLIEPKRSDFKYDYTFDEMGNILSKNNRNITKRASGEFVRFARVAVDSVRTYNDKDNRNIKTNLTIEEMNTIEKIVLLIQDNNNEKAYYSLKQLITEIQSRLIATQ